MYILYASVFAPLVAMMGKRFLEIARKHRFIILDLTVYEACNAFWKEYRRFHRLSVEDVLEFCSVIKFLANKLNVYGFKDLDFGKVVDIAIDNNITVYDSAYIALALELHIPIASEDKDILNVEPRYSIVVLKLNELLERMRLPSTLKDSTRVGEASTVTLFKWKDDGFVSFQPRPGCYN